MNSRGNQSPCFNDMKQYTFILFPPMTGKADDTCQKMTQPLSNIVNSTGLLGSVDPVYEGRYVFYLIEIKGILKNFKLILTFCTLFAKT
jgi:hypothetical protein